MATVRYIVDDVDASIAFYCEHLGFHEVMHPAPAFAMLVKDDLRFNLGSPVAEGQPGGSGPMADGTTQRPGGWNRISIEVSDLAATVAELQGAGVRFRSAIITGVGGDQALVEDPSGNLVELFQPKLPEAHERSAFASS